MPQVREVEIRQEARFVLWALRCAVLRSYGNSDAEAELARGFELARVSETLSQFWSLASALISVDWSPAVWHEPWCCCASNEELIILQAMAESAERLRGEQAEPAWRWRTIVPATSVGLIDAMARSWIAALDRAGVMFPRSAELVQSLRPLENITQPAGMARLH
ncbi:MAG: hypothetical protein WDO12_01320 [Pseudomonadota bacterium]